mmetsp:Transcript_54308/g.129419  ORF Transcript_54308/g.129419 Transcript_54308/m.129419 type:complete len:95 (+) Transcript_54308:32-316(+)
MGGTTALSHSSQVRWILVLVLCLSLYAVRGQEEEEDSTPGFLSNPECWVNWKIATEEEDGLDACREIEWVKIVNVFVFYYLLCYAVKALLLCTL